MNNRINEQAIEKYLSSTGKTISQNYVYAYVLYKKDFIKPLAKQ